jgi:predicted ATPase
MIIEKLIIENWRNFTKAEVELKDRMFLVGPNASGKSNFLDVFRFLKDIAKSGGGLQTALESRGGLSKVRCLHARSNPIVSITLCLRDDGVLWTYKLSVKNDTRHIQGPIVGEEIVTKSGDVILNRPNSDDQKDRMRLTQTHLEQISANHSFRPISEYFASFSYLHLVPQLIRVPGIMNGTKISDDSYGQNFLLKVCTEKKNTRDSRLRRITEILHHAIPNIHKINAVFDGQGNPHLEAEFENWRKNPAKQIEDQFSDGTLRLVGLLWSVLESKSLLLLEEPELSLHDAINQKLPKLIHAMSMKKKKKERSQIFISTHSSALLNDPSIGSDEVLLLKPTQEGTTITSASKIELLRTLMESGMTAADIAINETKPDKIDQLEFPF